MTPKISIFTNNP